MGWNYISILELQQCSRCSLGMDKYFHPAYLRSMVLANAMIEFMCKFNPFSALERNAWEILVIIDTITATFFFRVASQLKPLLHHKGCILQRNFIRRLWYRIHCYVFMWLLFRTVLHASRVAIFSWVLTVRVTAVHIRNQTRFLRFFPCLWL